MLLYAFTILVSAFLLFQVEPVIAKIILPWFGGSAAVWTVCLLFFQLVLLLGYVYAHLLARWFTPRKQGAIQASLAVLPILPGAHWKPAGGEEPTLRILLLLSATVGLPYFLLSTTGPLVQSWYALRFRESVPYRLYALSNAGSMFALLSYPVLIEPAFSTRFQALGWSFGYVAFVLLCGTAAFASRGAAPVAEKEHGNAAAPDGRTYFFWIALPACASILLLAVTNHLSQNVAAIPFLWVLPLSIYLLTFILCFERSAWYRRNPLLQLFAVSLGSMAYALVEDVDNGGIKMLIPVFGGALFFCCMVCHGELARLKPHPRYLTSYYVMISAGGALGGVFVGLAAPYLFRGYFELHVGLALTGMVGFLVLRTDPESLFHGSWRRPMPLVGAALTAGLVIYVTVEVRQSLADYPIMVRNFYGSLKVRDTGSAAESDSVRKLVHGTIDHGEQFLNPQRKRMPTTYYGPKSGVGLAIRERQPSGPMRVGVIGLGTGTLAAYSRPGDYYRFYEINPLVIDLASHSFTYIKDTMAKVEIALGDARLSLEREQPENFDVLAVDAFSGDSIPVHLLTREAFVLYFRHLKPGGALAVHVSNKYLDLQPVVLMAADTLHLRAMVVDTSDEDNNAIFGATWVLVTARPELFESALLKPVAATMERKKSMRLWTDDYSNLFQILK